MSTLKSARSLALVACMTAAAPFAWGQSMYRCNNGSSTFLSDRPCPSNGDTKIVAYGPASTNPSSSRSYAGPNVAKAPDHLQYLSPACAQINDAIRTASARGVGAATQRELREEYQRKCSEDDQAARQQASQDKSQQRVMAKAERTAEQQEKARAAASREQCSEMLRILHEKRKRFDAMTEGERGDFQRFEANYKARCAAG